LSKALSMGTLDKGKAAVAPRDLGVLRTCEIDRCARLAQVVKAQAQGLACLCVPAPPE
jgi:hypothetical protein